MKALSIKQPWAWLICAGYKGIENRNWATTYRGRIYVHAGKWWDAVGRDEIWEQLNENDPDLEMTYEYWKQRWTKENMRTDGKVSEIIGEVAIVDCITDSKPAWAVEGQYHFVLANPELYSQPIPYRGQLGFFEVNLPE